MNNSKNNKRIKRVFSSADQVLHLFMNQSQSDARCKNLFFRETKAYSYGEHYLLAEIIKYKGKTVVLINNDKYSATTNKHIWQTYNAASHLITLSASREAWTVKGALKLKQTELLNSYQKHFKQRKFYDYNNNKYKSKYGLSVDIKDFNKLCQQLGESKFKIKLTAKQIKAYDDYIKERIKRQAELESPEGLARREQARLKREQANLNKAAKDIQAWREGGQLTKAVRDLNPQIIRVKDSMVQTSKGAEVLLSEAIGLLNKLKQGQAKQGEQIGSFRFTDLSAAGLVRIGCHTISLSEAEAVLNQYNLRLVNSL